MSGRWYYLLNKIISHKDGASIFSQAKVLPPESVYGRYWDLRQRGKNYRGTCPNPSHVDKNPSFVVNPKNGSGHCYSCGLHFGDVIDFVAYLFNLRPHEAALKIAQDFGIPIVNNYSSTRIAQYRTELKRIQRLREQQQRFELWIDLTHKRLAFMYRCIQRVKHSIDLYAPLADMESKLEYYMDILQFGPREAQDSLYKLHQKGEMPV